MPGNPGQMQMRMGGQPGMPQQMAPTNLSPQENVMINTIAQRLFQQSSEQEREMVRQRILNGPQAELQMLQARGIDPVQWHYRRMAHQRYLMQKKQQEAQGQPQQGNLGAGLAGSLQGQVNQAQNLVNGAPSQLGIGQSGFGGNFGGNVQELMGLQESARQAQEAGRQVVPASQQRMANQSGQSQQGGQMGLHNTPQQMINQPSLLQKANAPQAQPRPPSVPNPAQRQQALQGQAGGLTTGPGPHTPAQQNSAMPNLNRPMDPNLSRPQSQAQQKQQPPRVGPSPAAGQAARGGVNQTSQAQRQQLAPNSQQGQPPTSQNQKILDGLFRSLPPPIQQKLASKPMAERNAFIIRMLQSRQKSQPSQAQPQPQSQAQKPQKQQSAPQQAQAPRNEEKEPGSKPGTFPKVQQNDFLSILNPAITGSRLNKEQVERMDQLPYPTNMLNNMTAMQHIPAEVKTWGALKQWCKSHQHIVPMESIRKLDTFQAMHASQIAKHQIASESQKPSNTANQQPSGQAMAHTASNQAGPAPKAPMGQQRPNQPPHVIPPALASHPIMQVSLQEVQAVREKIPPNVQSFSDDQLKMMIIKKRMHAANSQAIARGQQPPFPTAVPPANSNQQGQFPQPPQPPSKAGAQAQPAIGQQDKGPAHATAQKGVKRPNKAPEVRGSNVTLQQPPAATKQPAQMQRVSSNQGSKPVQQQIPAQTAHQLQQIPGPRNPVPPQSVEEKLMARFREIRDEVAKNFVRRPPLILDDATRAQIVETLKENAPFVYRMEHGLSQYFKSVNNDENNIREALKLRQTLLSQYQQPTQYQPNQLPPNLIPAQQFTITSADLADAILKVRTIFFEVTRKRRETGGIDQSHPISGQPQATPRQTEQSQQETASQPMIKQQSRQKHAREKEPPAPTTDKPPFAIGASLPHGIPTYGQQIPELTQDKLVMPQPKRRKTEKDNQSAKTTSPVPAPTKRPAAAPPKPEPAFKCQVTGCEHGKKGFMTSDDLQRHVEEAHKEKDPEDPLAFVLEQARNALGLDVNGKPVQKEKPIKMEKSLSAQPMKQSASAQGPTPKLEGGTPMSRGTTHLSQMGGPRTPQPMVKPAENKATPRSGHGRTDHPTPSREPATPDPWTDIGLMPQDLAAHFPAIGDVQGTLSVTSLTPSSTLATKSDKETPKSDIGEDASIKINIESDSWLPPGFLMDCYDRDIDTSFVNDDVLGMDWETAFPSSTHDAKKGKKRSADTDFRSDLFGFSFDDNF